MNAVDLPGLDLARLRGYFDDALPGAVDGPLRATLIAGGKSNLTYEVSDGATNWIVRRPPLGHVLATAHDMTREYRVMTALAPTDVPVPATYALCEDPDVLGAPFYVMAKVDGTPYRYAEQLVRLGARRTAAISGRMVETLALLHRVDPAEVGLTDFGRPDGFLARQVRRWKKQLDASRSRDLAGVDELHTLLAQKLPAELPPAIVHGDFRLDNLLIDADDQVTAVLDWEMATIGDPLTDVSLLVVYRTIGEIGAGSSISDVARAPGFLSADELLRTYAEHTDRDLADIGFYLGLANFKLAVIAEGIYYRHTHGQTVGAGFGDIGAVVEPLIQAGLAAIKE